MIILEFIENNWQSLVAVVLFALFIMRMWQSGRSEMVKELILSLVVKAEDVYGAGTGEIKYASVVEGIYRVLPPIVTFFLTEKELDNMIEEQVKYWKECLQGESYLLGIQEEVI